MNKQSLRKIALEKRTKIDANGAAENFAHNFLTNVKLKQNSIIASYIPIRNELDTRFLCAALQDAGHHICLPRIAAAEMNFHSYKIGDELALNKFGIAEPLASAQKIEPNVILVPMLAFDGSKNRLGYGGGYYDRYLHNSAALKIGVAFSAQQVEHIATEPHDIKMDMIITESKIY